MSSYRNSDILHTDYQYEALHVTQIIKYDRIGEGQEKRGRGEERERSGRGGIGQEREG